MAQRYDRSGNKWKIKSYNHNKRCVILDEPCFKVGIDCKSLCTRIQHRSVQSIKVPVVEQVFVYEPSPETLIEPVYEAKPEYHNSPEEVIPTKTIPRQTGYSPSDYENDYTPITEQLKQSTPTKKISLWNRFTGFIKSIFKPSNKKPKQPSNKKPKQPSNKKPKQPRRGGGKIYEWKTRNGVFGKKRVK